MRLYLYYCKDVVCMLSMLIPRYAFFYSACPLTSNLNLLRPDQHAFSNKFPSKTLVGMSHEHLHHLFRLSSKYNGGIPAPAHQR
jgi:hypothetical protein